MKKILFRFEKTIIHFIEVETQDGNLLVSGAQKIMLVAYSNEGQRYRAIYDELLQLHAKYPTHSFVYQLPMAFKGKVDADRFANEAILKLFCYDNNIQLDSLYRPDVRVKCGLTDKDMKAQEKSLAIDVSTQYGIAKSNMLLDGVVYLYMLNK